MDKNPWADCGSFDAYVNQNAPSGNPEQIQSYTSVPQGGEHNYGYGPGGAETLKKRQEKKTLRRLSLYIGGALLLTVLIQNMLVVFLGIIGKLELYLENEIFQASYDIFLMAAGMLLPFMLMGKKMKKVSGEINPVPLNKPANKADFFLAVVAGVGICFAANYVTSFVTVIMSFFGLVASSPEITMPDGVFGVVLSFARIAVMAGIVEELSMRGCVMGNLRKYGDGFAILMSTFVFSFMHGNLIQSPFALVAGVALGYFSVKTNSLWTGIIIHTLNNGTAVLFTYLYDYLPEEMVSIAHLLVMWCTIVIGLIALVVFLSRTKNVALKENQTSLSFGESVKCFLLSPTMIVSMLYMVYVTVTFISTAKQ